MNRTLPFALLSILADRTASPLSVEGIANGLAISKTTVERYIVLFEEVFLVKRIPAWTNFATNRATRQRKLVFVDSGMCAHLSGLSAERLHRDPSRGGPLIAPRPARTSTSAYCSTPALRYWVWVTA